MTPCRGPVCRPAGSVGLDDYVTGEVDRERQAVAPEPVHGDRDVDVVQERSESRRLRGVVQSRGEMDP